MPRGLCTAYEGTQGNYEMTRTLAPRLLFVKVMAILDTSLDWITERLDRKFVSAMERCVHENPDTKKEMRLLKRTVLVLLCLGLAISAVSIKFSVEAQMAYAILG